MKAAVLLVVSLLVTVNSITFPAFPVCTFTQCAYLWYGNFIPSTTTTDINFFIDGTAVVSNVPYSTESVVAIQCNQTDQLTFSIGSSAGAGDMTNTRVKYGSPTPPPYGLVCGDLYSFFAYRRPNSDGQEVYGVAVTTLAYPTTTSFVYGYVFNFIYNGNNINVAYCRYDNNVNNCENGGRNNVNVATTTFDVMDMMYLNAQNGDSAYGNPVTMNTNVNNQNDQLVNTRFTVAANGAILWKFWGDANGNDGFPVQGGSSAPYTAASFVLIALLQLALLF